MKTLKTPVTPMQQRIKKANSMAHKPVTGMSIKPIKPARPAFAKKPKGM